MCLSHDSRLNYVCARQPAYNPRNAHTHTTIVRPASTTARCVHRQQIAVRRASVCTHTIRQNPLRISRITHCYVECASARAHTLCENACAVRSKCETFILYLQQEECPRCVRRRRRRSRARVQQQRERTFVPNVNHIVRGAHSLYTII